MYQLGWHRPSLFHFDAVDASKILCMNLPFRLFCRRTWATNPWRFRARGRNQLAATSLSFVCICLFFPHPYHPFLTRAVYVGNEGMIHNHFHDNPSNPQQPIQQPCVVHAPVMFFPIRSQRFRCFTVQQGNPRDSPVCF